MKTRISLLLVDDHACLRETLGLRLANEPEMAVVGMVGDANRAIHEAAKLKPDIVLMDIDMPGMPCFDAAKIIRKTCPDTQIVFLSAFVHDRYVERALAVEAAGYITKSEHVGSIINAILGVANGGSYFSCEVQDRIVVDAKGTRLARKKQHSRTSTLTLRELEVLSYIATGMSQKEMAQTMHLSDKTVHCHSIKLMTKLDIHDRVELTRFAIREGLARA